MKIFRQLNNSWKKWNLQRHIKKLERAEVSYRSGYSGGYSDGHEIGYLKGKVNGRKFMPRLALVGTRYYRIEVKNQRLYLNGKEFCGKLAKQK